MRVDLSRTGFMLDLPRESTLGVGPEEGPGEPSAPSSSAGLDDMSGGSCEGGGGTAGAHWRGGVDPSGARLVRERLTSVLSMSMMVVRSGMARTPDWGREGSGGRLRAELVGDPVSLQVQRVGAGGPSPPGGDESVGVTGSVALRLRPRLIVCVLGP